MIEIVLGSIGLALAVFAIWAKNQPFDHTRPRLAAAVLAVLYFVVLIWFIGIGVR